MASMLQPVGELRACAGGHVVIAAGHPDSTVGRGIAAEEAEMALASILGERDARGAATPVVTLCVTGAADALAAVRGGWVEPAVRWLRAHGRRVIVRTRRVLARSIVDLLRELGGSVEIELAHPRPELQTALLDSGADSPAALLLQSQHLVSSSIPVSARLAPLLPGIHDRPRSFQALVRNLVAADVWDAHLEVGTLRPTILRGLEACAGRWVVAPGAVMDLRRAFGLAPLELSASAAHGTRGEPRWRLPRTRAAILERALRRVAESEGLRVDACGCAAHCHSVQGSARPGTREPAYVSVVGPELFGDLRSA